MPILYLLAGLLVLGALAGDNDQRTVAKRTVTLQPGERYDLPRGSLLVASDGRVFRGPLTVHVSSTKSEEIFADMGPDGVRSIKWP